MSFFQDLQSVDISKAHIAQNDVKFGRPKLRQGVCPRSTKA